MGKKSKNRQPNAPELQQVLLESHFQQPPHNPYYPDLNSSQSNRYNPPPPPYAGYSMSDSVPMTQVSQPQYPRSSPAALPRQTTVIVQQANDFVGRRVEKHCRKVRKFNNELFWLALLVLGLSGMAYSQYQRRTCLNYLVHRPTKDISVMLVDIRDMHLWVAYGSIIMMLLALVKCCDTNGKSHSCYLFLISLVSFVLTLFTGYLAYLAFYSPCTISPTENISNMFKSVVGIIVKDLPSPDKGVFNESNVIQLAKDDREGLVIFIIDVFNCIVYFSCFISASVLC